MDYKKETFKAIMKTIYYDFLIFSIFALFSFGPINALLSKIPLLHFEDIRGTIIYLETDGNFPPPKGLSLRQFNSITIGFYNIGYYIGMIITITIVYQLFKLFAESFTGVVFIFVALCIINFFVITAFDGAIDIRFISLIQVILGPKIMLIIGCIYRFFFVEH